VEKGGEQRDDLFVISQSRVFGAVALAYMQKMAPHVYNVATLVMLVALG
jgi:hypothetical protein